MRSTNSFKILAGNSTGLGRCRASILQRLRGIFPETVEALALRRRTAFPAIVGKPFREIIVEFAVRSAGAKGWPKLPRWQSLPLVEEPARNQFAVHGHAPFCHRIKRLGALVVRG